MSIYATTDDEDEHDGRLVETGHEAGLLRAEEREARRLVDCYCNAFAEAKAISAWHLLPLGLSPAETLARLADYPEENWPPDAWETNASILLDRHDRALAALELWRKPNVSKH